VRRCAPRALPWAPLLAATLVACGGDARGPGAAAPNVVLFVGDGLGVGAWAVARAWAASRGSELTLDGAPHAGFVDTRALDRIVTDSAAAATAWALGRPGRNRVIGIAPDPAPTLFERLAASGRAAGFVTTTRVTHATPAPFFARAPDRDDEDAIALQLVSAMPEVAIGGGRRHFRPGRGGRRDGRDLLAEAREGGVAVLDSLASPLPEDRKVLLLLADSHLPHALDAPSGPDLADLVAAAIRRLSARGAGWFLLVEEGRIDHAGHAHDAPALVQDVARLDRAVAAALQEVDLARTLVAVTSDHGTGAPTLHEDARPESLDVASASVETMDRRIFGDGPWRGTPEGLLERALPVLAEGCAFAGLSAADLDRLVSAKDPGDRRAALGTAVSRRFGITFMAHEDHLSSRAVHGHTGEPVPIRAWGVRAEEVEGIRDHAALGRWLADVLGLPATAKARPVAAAADPLRTDPPPAPGAD
jgi:alkaline phosphatase